MFTKVLDRDIFWPQCVLVYDFFFNTKKLYKMEHNGVKYGPNQLAFKYHMSAI